MTPKRIALIVVAVIVVVILVLFFVQNSATNVNVIFKLTPGLAWDLGPEGISLPLLLTIDFLVGMLVTSLVLGAVVVRANRQGRTMQRQITALQDEIEFSRRNESKPSRSFARPTPSPAVSPLPAEPPAQQESGDDFLGDFDDI